MGERGWLQGFVVIISYANGAEGGAASREPCLSFSIRSANGRDINRIVKSRPTLPSSAARIVRIMLNPSLRSQCRRVTPRNESLLETTRPFTAWLRYGGAAIHGDHRRKYGKKNPQLGEPRIRLVATFSAEVRCRASIAHTYTRSASGDERVGNQPTPVKAIRRQPKRKLHFGFCLFPGLTIFPAQRYITEHRVHSMHARYIQAYWSGHTCPSYFSVVRYAAETRGNFFPLVPIQYFICA